MTAVVLCIDAKEKEVKQTDSEKREFGRDMLLIPEELESVCHRLSGYHHCLRSVCCDAD